MAYLEEHLMPRVYAALKEVGHPIAAEIERVMGWPNDEDRARVLAEAQHSTEQAAAAGTPVVVPVEDAKAAADQAPVDASWTDVAAQAKAKLGPPTVNPIF